MALRRFFDCRDALGSCFRSCRAHSGTDSHASLSPRSLSPEDEIIHRENTDSPENTPSITDENHDGTGSHHGMSALLVFPGDSSSIDSENRSLWRRLRNTSILKKIKPWFFLLLAVTFSVLFAIHKEVPETAKLLAIKHSFPKYVKLGDTQGTAVVTVKVSGPFLEEGEDTKSQQNLTIGLVNKNGTTTTMEVSTNIGINCSWTTNADPVIRETRLGFAENNNITHMMLSLDLNTPDPIAISLKYYLEPLTLEQQVIVAAVILFGVYILIMSELVHRTTAAMLGALAALSFLSYINKRPSLETILKWVEWEALTLLFGMMILVAVFAKTGFFDYVALKAYKLSRGRVWLLITILCAFTTVVSIFLDNVTVILLLTPVTVTLCQVMNLNPTHILIAEVIFSNIGGTATAIGDNVMLVASKEIKKEIKAQAEVDINFGDFLQNLIVGEIFCALVAYGVLRLLYRNVKIVNDDPPIIEELKREAEIWRRSANHLLAVSAEEKTVKLLLMQKVMALENTIRNMKRSTPRQEAFERSLPELERKYVIRDKELLIKSLVVIIAVIVLFFAHPYATGFHLDIGWIAILGAILLILLADITHFEDLMEQVEWTTLVFFSGLFILMRSLNELGLMEWLGDKTSKLIEKLGRNAGDDEVKCIALIVILWVSALVSSVIDNIPSLTAMIPIVVQLSQQTKLDLPPLIWALAMGCNLGGNGTLIGSSANVVCAGLAEQYGYPITFNKYCKVGFPIMLATIATATIYLMIAQFLW